MCRARGLVGPGGFRPLPACRSTAGGRADMDMMLTGESKKKVAYIAGRYFTDNASVLLFCSVRAVRMFVKSIWRGISATGGSKQSKYTRNDCVTAPFPNSLLAGWKGQRPAYIFPFFLPKPIT